MDLKSTFLLAVFLACLGLLIWLAYKSFVKELDRQEKGAIERLQKYIRELASSKLEYRFYTTGHPYTWSETSEKEIYKSFKNLKYSRGARPTDFLIKVNEPRKAIYIVYTRAKDFDWDSLLHYDDWLKSQEGTREAIANYKRRI